MDLAGNDKRLPFLSRIDGKTVFFQVCTGLAGGSDRRYRDLLDKKKGQLSSWPKGGLVNKNRRDFAKDTGVSHGLLLAE